MRFFHSLSKPAAYAALLFSLATAAAGQDPTPSPAVPTPTPRISEETEIIKIDTELVNLNVRVVDRFSRPIGNLKPSDFKIYEDNVLQEIEFFSQSEVPTNYSMVIDNSGSLRSQIEKVIEASKILIGSNRPGDETSIIRFVGRDSIEILQDFTSVKDDLEYALDNLHIDGGQTALRDAVYLAAERVTEYEKTLDDDRKRRALILVTDGEDRASYYDEKQLFQLLNETSVQIYVVGFVKELDDKGSFIQKSEQSKAKSFLQKLATETGGKAYFPENLGDLNRIAQEISAELRTQYSIGYLPSNDREDGTVRNIRVTMSDGPDKQKRIPITRTSRVAGRSDGSPSLQKAAPAGKDQ